MEPQQPQELGDVQWQALKKALSYSRVTRFKSPQEFMTAFSRGQATKAPAPVPTAKPEAPAPQVVEPPPSIQAEPVAAQAEPVAATEPEPMQIGQDETTQVALDTPMRAERDPIMFEPDEDEPRRSPWRLVVVGIILIMSVAVVLKPELIETLGLEDPLASLSALVDDIATEDTSAEIPSAGGASEEIEDLQALPETDVADTTAVNANDNVIEELVIDVDGGAVEEIASADQDEAALEDSQIGSQVEVLPEEPEPLPPPIDFSQLPEPTLLLTLADGTGTDTPSASLTLREDGDAGLIDLVRGDDLAIPYSVRFVETATSGNQSAWESGQYQFADDGLLVFDAGQPRARIELTMRSNPVREPDRDVTLSVVDADDADVVLASIRLTLEDDDQRSFEASLAPNTVGFAVNQVSVREFDPAVQVDVIRYRADNTAVEISYTLTDVTATEGQDYFAPGISEVYFGPGQRTARILIPLGQDARPEQDEAFMLELDAPDAPADSEIYRQIAVMIRDDDS